MEDRKKYYLSIEQRSLLVDAVLSYKEKHGTVNLKKDAIVNDAFVLNKEIDKAEQVFQKCDEIYELIKIQDYER